MSGGTGGFSIFPSNPLLSAFLFLPFTCFYMRSPWITVLVALTVSLFCALFITWFLDPILSAIVIPTFAPLIEGPYSFAYI
jgi:hypothetical protein